VSKRLSISNVDLIEKRSDETDKVDLVNEIRALLNREGRFYRALTTTNATPTEIWRTTMSPGSAIKLHIDILGNDPAGPSTVGYVVDALYVYSGGAGSVDEQATYNYEDSPAYDYDLSASGDDVVLTVTGLAATTVYWNVAVHALEVPWA
jgi:hypothetical protein